MQNCTHENCLDSNLNFSFQNFTPHLTELLQQDMHWTYQEVTTITKAQPSTTSTFCNVLLNVLYKPCQCEWKENMITSGHQYCSAWLYSTLISLLQSSPLISFSSLWEIPLIPALISGKRQNLSVGLTQQEEYDLGHFSFYRIHVYWVGWLLIKCDIFLFTFNNMGNVFRGFVK